eukprot:607020_1
MGNDLRLKAKKNNTIHTHSDGFIIKYSQNANDTANSDCPNIESYDTRRIVFVSALGLYQTWKQCSSSELYTAFLVMPLKKIWIDKPSRHRQHISFLTDDIRSAETKQFLNMLKWKCSQGLVCWLLDEYPSKYDLDDVDPIWYHLNEILQGLYDPVTSQNYDPISLDDVYWESSDYVSKYNVRSRDVLNEMRLPSMRYDVLSEMLYQSNPQSLLPIISMKHEKMTTINLCDHRETNSKDLVVNECDGSGWWISDAYECDA